MPNTRVLLFFASLHSKPSIRWLNEVINLNKLAKVVGAIFLIVSICMVASCETIRYDHGFCGKIIDKETNDPIPGVIIIADWENVTPTPGGAVHTVYKVREIASDTKGEFCLKGPGFVFFVDEPSIEIFKAGYENIADSYLPNLKNVYYVNKWHNGNINWNRNKAIIKLRKLTIQEREERYRGISKFDCYINQGITVSDKGQTGSNDKVNANRKLFDLEVRKEREEIKSYQNLVNPPKNEFRPLTIIPMNQ